jgi:hypothetical protein
MEAQAAGQQRRPNEKQDDEVAESVIEIHGQKAHIKLVNPVLAR